MQIAVVERHRQRQLYRRNETVNYPVTARHGLPPATGTISNRDSFGPPLRSAARLAVSFSLLFYSLARDQVSLSKRKNLKSFSPLSIPLSLFSRERRGGSKRRGGEGVEERENPTRLENRGGRGQRERERERGSAKRENLRAMIYRLVDFTATIVATHLHLGADGGSTAWLRRRKGRRTWRIKQTYHAMWPNENKHCHRPPLRPTPSSTAQR